MGYPLEPALDSPLDMSPPPIPPGERVDVEGGLGKTKVDGEDFPPPALGGESFPPG